jgi:triacylglycerol lipase
MTRLAFDYESMKAHAVLLHGLGRSSRSMRPLERRLRAGGYEVLNADYPSRTADVASLASYIATQVHAFGDGRPLDFITHSLGGILLRAAVHANLIGAERVRRVVMLGPPNSGSELADVLPRVPLVGAFYRRFTGPAGMQLGTEMSAIAGTLPAVPFELGVIAGNRSYNPLFSAILDGPSDGKVRVDRTRVEGMRDFLVVPHWHPLLMSAPVVIDQALHFLEHGAFRRAAV